MFHFSYHTRVSLYRFRICQPQATVTLSRRHLQGGIFFCIFFKNDAAHFPKVLSGWKALRDTHTCGCGVRLHDIKNGIGMDLSGAPHLQEPRRHDGSPPRPAQLGESVYNYYGFCLLKMHAPISVSNKAHWNRRRRLLHYFF